MKNSKMESLEFLLRSEVKNNHEQIEKEYEIFASGDSIYKNLEVNDNLQLVLRKGVGENLMSIGFPFPLKSFELGKFQYDGNVSAHLFLRGLPVREYQKGEIFADISEIGLVNAHEITSLDEFRGITKRICESFEDVDTSKDVVEELNEL